MTFLNLAFKRNGHGPLEGVGRYQAVVSSTKRTIIVADIHYEAGRWIVKYRPSFTESGTAIERLFVSKNRAMHDVDKTLLDRLEAS